MKKPLVGIVAKPCMETDLWHYMEIVDEIRKVLVTNHALVIGILPTNRKIGFELDENLDNCQLSLQEMEDLEELLCHLDGIVLEGGLVSNQYEEEIAKICIKKDIPILGICSGFNNLIRAMGGSVHIDDNIFHNQFGSKIAHDIEIEKNSTLFQIMKEKKLKVNSIHTCIAKKEEIKAYKVVATCPLDDTVEAIELEGKKFVMGIKWHPELMETMNPIFHEFVKRCSKEEI